MFLTSRIFDSDLRFPFTCFSIVCYDLNSSINSIIEFFGSIPTHYRHVKTKHCSQRHMKPCADFLRSWSRSCISISPCSIVARGGIGKLAVSDNDPVLLDLTHFVANARIVSESLHRLDTICYGGLLEPKLLGSDDHIFPPEISSGASASYSSSSSAIVSQDKMSEGCKLLLAKLRRLGAHQGHIDFSSIPGLVEAELLNLQRLGVVSLIHSSSGKQISINQHYTTWKSTRSIGNPRLVLELEVDDKRELSRPKLYHQVRLHTLRWLPSAERLAPFRGVSLFIL